MFPRPNRFGCWIAIAGLLVCAISGVATYASLITTENPNPRVELFAGRGIWVGAGIAVIGVIAALFGRRE